MSVGTDTVSCRLGVRSTSRIPSSSPILSAATSNCRWEISNGLRFSWAMVVRRLSLATPAPPTARCGLKSRDSRPLAERRSNGAFCAPKTGFQALGLGELPRRVALPALPVVHVGQHVVAERCRLRRRLGLEAPLGQVARPRRAGPRPAPRGRGRSSGRRSRGPARRRRAASARYAVAVPARAQELRQVEPCAAVVGVGRELLRGRAAPPPATSPRASRMRARLKRAGAQPRLELQARAHRCLRLREVAALEREHAQRRCSAAPIFGFAASAP